ncbi:hypothetical protein PhiCh1p25 [Natrialba phage PhiCh1]|uniref:Virus protein phiCh1-VP24 n=2 Tax=root TaxID=1 RepID=D3T2H2_NATMM|nr:hypothetical protein [Natrialba magadii]NP_665942.1 hypothetical protein PhiCh1p25 [Natrialba phage PhiCh1]YP_010078053.1 uncharacterized protein KMC42_gp23 [Natrialba phage PhiCh1]AAM88698.1 unknown [Natrialba phage PhiCh1]ADD07781.1 virus protein phiCh1-VP24 [Natrialba magadii ATCC 43099]ELY23028.1 hypothetical protein C500_21230 [Natrialba magadii ATCC 43099]QBJ01204.1 uncharacterized protein PhiCh1_110 [Natrialba phage PhiCh1]
MTTVTIEDIVFDGIPSSDIDVEGVTSVDDSGAWDAPEQAVEKGFDYSSYNQPEPITASFEAWATPEHRATLVELRDATEPFAASVDQLVLGSAKLTQLDTNREVSSASHYRVTVEFEEVREAELETAEMSVESDSGDLSSSSEDADVSYEQPEEDDTGTSEETTDDGGIVGALSSVREGLSGVL